MQSVVRIVVSVLWLACALLCAACSSSSRSLQEFGSGITPGALAPVAGPDLPVAGVSRPSSPPVQGLGLKLPAPQQLLALAQTQRGARFTAGDGHKDGNQYNGGLGSNRVSAAGSAATFDPAFNPAADSGLDGLAYAIYDFILPSPTPGALADFNWGISPSSAAMWFVGLANFTANRWDWFAGPDGMSLTIEQLSTYMTASDDFFLVVAVQGLDSASLTEIQLQGVEPPHAQLIADVGSGLAPLLVTFDASGSVDTDGTIADYEWDLNGNGVYNEPTAENAARNDSTPPAYSYSSAGDFHVSVRVTDDDGATAVAGLVIAVNYAPTVLLSADVTSGAQPLAVTFTATANDANGTIDEIEWDFNGDAVFNEAGAETIAHGDATPAACTYSAPGSFDATVRVTDNDGATAVDSVTVSVGGPPQVDLTANVESGPKPLAVSFTATAADPGGSITEYEWDFNGNLVYNEAGAEDSAQGNATPAAYTYTAAGIYDARVRVTDNDSGTATDTLQIMVTNTPPNAALSADTAEGDAPLAVTFDASASADPGGSISDYEWDLDGNGTFNEAGAEATAHGSATPVAYSFDNPGLFNAAVRVTDDDGATDTATLAITAHGWSVITVDDPVGLDAGYNLGLKIIGGKPAIAQATLTERTLRFTRSSTADGASPSDWTSVMIENVNNPIRCRLADINGNPAISYFKDSGTGGLLYTRSTTVAGDQTADWITPVEVDTTGSTRGLDSSILEVNGVPAIAYNDSGNADLRYAISSTADGASASDWSDVLVDSGGTGWAGGWPWLTLVNGNPAIAYLGTDAAFNYLIRYARSSTASGGAAGDWASKQTIYSNATTAHYPSLAVVNGNPALSFQDGNYNLHYKRATDAVGLPGNWTQDAIIDGSGTETGEYSSLGFFGGYPAVAHHYKQLNDCMFIMSTTADGSASADWANKEVVQSAGTVGRFTSLTQLPNGRMAVAFRNEGSASVMYAIRY